MKTPLWQPSTERIANANITHYLQYLHDTHGLELTTYQALHAWSVEQTEAFWGSVWDWCGLDALASQPYTSVWQAGDGMVGSRWFEGARFNFAECLLQGPDTQPAVVFRNELGTTTTQTYADLKRDVARLAAALRSRGVVAGDRIAGYIPNIPEAIVAMLAATSIGAVWSSTSPDFGEAGVLDRFGQIEPKVLFVADGYFYKGKPISSLKRVPRICGELPSVQEVIVVPYTSITPDLSGLGVSATLWGDALAEGDGASLVFEQLPFDHPLYILYSSGTTGVPKCIVHGAGGTLLQHLKEHRLHADVHPGDRVYYFTTCGWMMWNWLVSGLASSATVMLFDGNPFYPDPGVQFRYVEEHGIKVFGTSAKFLAALEKTGLKPAEEYDLSPLSAVLSTGSPLSAASFEYVYRDIKADVHLASISGGTDIVSCFMLGCPTLPVYSEEIQVAGLGMKVEVFDLDGQAVQEEKGELVCTRPFPSQPIYFWNDPDNARYRGAYFEHFPGAWRHGDLVERTAQDGIIIYGRSDATLNPGGVRIGTAEIYRVIEPIPEVLDSIVVGHDIEGDDMEVVLFVKLAEGAKLDDALRRHLRTSIRAQASPRHVPAHIIAVADVPYTISGKKVELAVRRVIHGLDVPNRDALANPEALAFYRDVFQ